MSAPDSMAHWIPATIFCEVPVPSSFRTLAAMILDWGGDADDSFGVASGGNDARDVSTVTLGVIGC